MLRIAVVGHGYWGPNLVRNFSESGRFEVVAIAERRSEARAQIARRHPAVQVVESAAEAFAVPNVDAAAIATPVASHFDIAREALLSGKHVLVEKPLCTITAEGKELVTLAEKVNRVLMVDHTYLFTGAVQTIRRAIEKDELGKICYFDAMRVNLGLFQPDVNCLWDLAPHDLSIVDYLIEDEVVAIDATGYCHMKNGMPDMVFMTLHYASDWVSHLNLSWMSPVKIRRTTVGGTSKMLIWDDLDQDQKIKIYDHGIEIHGDEERSLIVPEYRIGDIHSPRVPINEEALAGVADHFIKVIVGEAQSIMDGSKGLRVVQLLEVAQRQLDKSLAHVAAQRAATWRDRAMSA